MDEIIVVRGKFLPVKVKGEVVTDPQRVEVVRSYKEKRSDVNLATFLLRDAYEKRCQLAAVVSSDSDLIAPVGLAHKKLPFGVVVLNPNTNPSGDLASVARQIQIPEGAFRACQLPPTVSDRKGRETRRPPDW